MTTTPNGRTLLTDAARAGLAGVLATIPMSAVMLGSDAAGRMGTQPPRRVVDKADEQLPGRNRSDASRSVAASLLHLLLGGAMAVGVLPFSWVARRLGNGWAAAVAAGGAFGLALYALNYVGLAPALGLLPPPSRDRTDRQVTMIAAHVVYGVAAALLVNVTSRDHARRA